MARGSRNVFWRDIPAGACVIDNGASYSARINGKRHLVYWDGQHAREAQRELARRAKKPCRR